MNADDDALLRELRDALDEATAHADVARIGHGLWDWRDPDRLLAALVADSATEPRATSGVRTTGGLRVLRFESGDTSIEVEVAEGHIRGLALSPGARTVDLRSPRLLLATAEVDGTGWFDLTVPANARGRAELVRLRLSDSDGKETWTVWFRL
jgi:hypothetical protein